MHTLLALVTAAFALSANPLGDGPVELRFAWPAEGSVGVVEQTTKAGKEATMSYVLRWAPDPEGGGTLLEYADFEIQSLAGLDRSNPIAKTAMRQAEVMAGAIPKLRIDAEGYLQEFVGFDEMLTKLLETLTTELDSSLAEQMGRALRQPQMQATIEQTGAETWNTWVANWVGCEVVRGAEEVWELDIETSGGVVPALTVTYGDLSEHRGLECVEITMTGVADEDLLRRRTLEMMGHLLDSMEQELPEELPIARMSRRDTSWGVYAVDGLRPLEVRRSSQIRVWASLDEEPEERIESHRYQFQWEDLAPEADDGTK